MLLDYKHRQKFLLPSNAQTNRRLPKAIGKLATRPQASASTEADVVLIGAGIVGVSICRQILRQSGGTCSVCLVDSQMPGCATGAGQGYIWMAHRQVGTPAWDLAKWSSQLWKESLTPQLRSAIEWQDMGSLLLASNAAEAEQLRERESQLQGEGLSPVLLNGQDLKDAEPALQVSDAMSGLLLQTDAQINGRRAAAVLLSECSQFGESFTMQNTESVTRLDSNTSGMVTGAILCDGTRLGAHRAVVISAGAWSSGLLTNALQDERWKELLQPRKGHLLEISSSQIDQPALNNGLMEIGYAMHYKISGKATVKPLKKPVGDVAVTFTATMSAAGSLLLGSSREFCGFSSEESQAVEKAILARAAAFLPALSDIQPGISNTRVGLRPYSSQGPIIGPSQGYRNLFVATGHEGSGLTLAPATACIIASKILEEGNIPAFAEKLTPEAVLAY